MTITKTLKSDYNTIYLDNYMEEKATLMKMASFQENKLGPSTPPWGIPTGDNLYMQILIIKDILNRLSLILSQGQIGNQ